MRVCVCACVCALQVVNVVTCSQANVKEVGDALCHNNSIKKLSFTGSTGVGTYLASECAKSMKRISMELGGNAPFIVFDDADVDAVSVRCFPGSARVSCSAVQCSAVPRG